MHAYTDTPTGTPPFAAEAAAVPQADLPDPRFKPYLLTSEVAELLHAAPKTVGNWAKQGKLPYQRTLGGHRRYPTGPILRLADALSATLRADPSTITARR